MDRRALPALLLTLLLAGAPVLHAAPADGLPVADSLVATDFTLEAREGLVRVGTAHRAAPVPAVGFHLEAQRIIVEYQNVTRFTPDSSSTEVPVEGPTFEPVVHYDAVVTELFARPERELSVLLDGAAVARLEGSAVGLASSARETAAFSNQVFSPPDPGTVSTAGLVRVAPAGRAAVTVEGDFLVSLWDVDVELRSPNDVVALHTGRRAAEDAPSVPAVGAGFYEFREILLHVRGGTLRMDPSFAADNNLFTDLADVVALRDPVVTAATATLRDVVGPLPSVLGAARADREDLDLTGDLRFDLRAAEPTGTDEPDPFSWTLGGRIDSAALDGAPLTVQVPAGPAAARAWLPLLAPLFLVGLLVAGGPLRVRSARRRLRDAELLFSSGHFDAAAHAAAGAAALRHREVTPQALALRVQALLHAGRTAEARRLAADPLLDRSDPILRRLVTVSVNDWRDE